MAQLATSHTLPAGYRLAHKLVLTKRRTLIWMNVIGSGIFVLAVVLVFTGQAFYGRLGAPLVLRDLPATLPTWIYFLLIGVTLLLHEALHGLVIAMQGYRPRFGAKLHKLVLFTTADVYFTRREYLAVTLAPLLGISLLGLLGMLLLPVGIALWVAIMVAMNAASSIGDIWMARVILCFPPQAHFHDDEDGMSVFMPA